MPPLAKFLIGLAASLLAAWIFHGPLGNGARLIGGIERQAAAAVAKASVPGTSVTLGHHPLSRTATLSGPADDIQREGMGSLPGLTEIVADVEGVSAVRWADAPGARARTMPLLAEVLLLAALANLIGLGIARLLFGRRKKQSYLD